MQISIDTSKDSHDDIRKAIALLQSIVSGAPTHTNSQNIFENPMPGESAAPAPAAQSLFSMFDASAPTAPPTQPVAEGEKDSDDHPVIELY